MKIKLLFILSLVLCQIGVIRAQQKRWILPLMNLSNQTTIPFLDFSNGLVTTGVVPVNSNTFTMSQALGYGEFCANCPNNAGSINKFFIVGDKDHSFRNASTSPIIYPMAVKYESSNTCGLVTTILNPNPTNPITEIAHSSLAEIAYGNGETNGSIWLVMQNSQTLSTMNGTAFSKGISFYVCLFDFYSNSIAYKEIPSGCENAPSYNSSHNTISTTFNEGVGFGPVFIFHDNGNADLNDLIGQRCRSIYIANYTDKTIDHFILNVQDPLHPVYYSDKVSTGNNVNQFYEIDLSFPQTDNINSLDRHPNYLGATGWSGVFLTALGNNGELLTGSSIGTIAGQYGCEFSQDDQYFYYATQSQPGNGIPAEVRSYQLQSPNSDVKIFDCSNTYPNGSTYTDHCGAMETAGDGNIYYLDYDQKLVRIDGPALNQKTDIIENLTEQFNTDFYNTANNSTPLQVYEIKNTFPDWVAGEHPLELPSNPDINICFSACNWPEGSLTVSLSEGGTVLESQIVSITDPCVHFNVCPNLNYTIAVNNDIIYNGVINSDLTINQMIGSNGTSGGAYTPIANYNITSDEVWSGKLYVDGIVTVSGDAILDLTNVDIIFAEDAGIVFEDKSMIRANNSVFRPCDLTHSWLGIDMTDNSIGWINECLIKNAVNSIEFYSYGRENYVDITNTEFYNYDIAIKFNTVAGFKGAITGNTFHMDDMHLTTINHDFYGIQLINSSLRNIISQNNFINSNKGNTDRFYGIHAISSNFNATSNNFTNLYRALNIENGSAHLAFEDNTIELTKDYPNFSDIVPIRISGNQLSSLIDIKGNRIISNSINNTSGVYQSAIYIETQNVNITDNEIKYFNYGIDIINNSNITVRNNFITNCKYGVQILDKNNGAYNILKNVIIADTYITNTYGVVYTHHVPSIASTAAAINIAENKIRVSWTGISYSVMPFEVSQFPLNSSYYYTGYNKIVNIDGNCIIEPDGFGIWVGCDYQNIPTTRLALPTIKNNNIYTFGSVSTSYHGGMFFRGFAGSIGSVTSPGRNNINMNRTTNSSYCKDLILVSSAITYSYNERSTLSCYQTGSTITQSNPGFPSFSTCNGNFSSPKSIETSETNFNEFLASYFPLLYEDEIYLLIPEFQSKLDMMSTKNLFAASRMMLNMFLNCNNTSDYSNLYNYLIASNKLNQDEIRILDYNYNKYIGNYNEASSILNKLSGTDPYNFDFIYLETLELNNLMGNLVFSKLSDSDILQLNAIDNARGTWASKARDFLQLAIGGHDYIFDKSNLSDEIFYLTNESNTNSSDLNNNFKVFPNPASNELTIYYNIQDNFNATISIQDMSGRKLIETPLEYNVCSKKYSISNFENGFYLITISRGNDILYREKLIKISE